MANNKRPPYRKNGGGTRNTPTQRTPLTVRERKKQLIRERVHKDAAKSSGMRYLGVFVTLIMLSRVGLFIYELAYYGAIGEKVRVIANLLLLPLLLLIYMAHDGNRGLLSITAISAIVRVFNLFLSVYPAIEGKNGAVAFASVYLGVMALQFIISVIALSMPAIALYCAEMRRINFELRMNIVGRR